MRPRVVACSKIWVWRVNGDNEEERRERVTLTQAPAMGNGGAGQPIEKDPRGGGREKRHKPIAEPARETPSLK
jgi:hypothetical protein